MKTISYACAVKRFGNSYILCNNIEQLDPSIWDNAEFELYDENSDPVDIFQYFLTDCSRSDVTYLAEWYGLKFTYSDMLDCYVLCVDHCGTSWDSVMIEDNSPRE